MTHFTEDEILNTTSLRTLGKEIHKRRAALFIIDKSEKGECPYSMYYKDQKLRHETRVRKEKEMKALLAEREILKLTTPKKEWYPKKRFCGRYRSDHNKIRRQIMREAFLKGFNVKSIAGYFEVTLPVVYRIIKVRALKLKIAEKKLLEDVGKG